MTSLLGASVQSVFGGWRVLLAFALVVASADTLLLSMLSMLQKTTNLFPYGLIDQIRAQLLVPAEPHVTKTIGIWADAAVIGVRTRMMLVRTWTQCFPVVSITATGTHNQALQQIGRPSVNRKRLRTASGLIGSMHMKI